MKRNGEQQPIKSVSANQIAVFWENLLENTRSQKTLKKYFFKKKFLISEKTFFCLKKTGIRGVCIN
jgi:hypothetical protein